jgi:CHAT domain-containing protein
MYNYVHAVQQANLARQMLVDTPINNQTQDTTQQEKTLSNHIQQMFETYSRQEPAEISPAIENIMRRKARIDALTKFDSPTATLQYFVAKDKLYILLGSRKSLMLKEVNVNELALQNTVRDFLGVVQNPSRDPLPKATELYQLLIQPVIADLQALNVNTILISPDSFLKQVPFAALHNGKQFLVQKYRLALLTPSTLTDTQQKKPKTYQIGAFGLSGAVNGFRALPGVKDELSNIVKHGRLGIFSGETNLDADFTEENLKKTLAKGYSVLHIASHFVFNPGRDTDSFLILGDGKVLSINHLKQKQFDFSNTELVVLSACDTASYGKNQNGIPVDGLANVLQVRGAKSIVATQWAIEDKSTSILIPQFYRNLANHLSKIAALGDAQRLFIERNLHLAVPKKASRGIIREVPISNFKANPKRPYAHPYFWAGFTLMGNIN